MSPVKIFKNLEGSLSRAAALQSALIKERREVREQQQRTMLDSTPKDLNRPWEDPMPETALTFGQRSKLSIQDQRHSLPIYKLKNELIQAVHDNQVLVVIGETGSGKTTQTTRYLGRWSIPRARLDVLTRGWLQCLWPRESLKSLARLGEEVGYAIRFEDRLGRNLMIKYNRRPEESRGKQRKAIPGCRRENQSDPVVAAAREMVLQTLLLPLLQTLLLPLQERHNDDWVRGRVCVSNRRENKRVT
ncbi:putative pre-mRNA-splicing factor ATP-dependent RNA helicase DEAH5 [Camellia lanceoleosa]|uniref:Pre-mRNA-splicing factor ATP-dependent RNA helicase DEAH5 n=1 Tax=Camellia lanceoleosa TaxID=1840588 RepID=A0ACC0H3D9_9ERIC|nr:putative pre-mRNA-splicing factor ATP-dependent RNA helicase DEAH5 [Camellia lanceoleosa]